MKHRYQFLKLQKFNSTKAERVVMEILKSNRIKFRAKVKLHNKEIDFLIKDKYVLEVGSHLQNPEKNKQILEAGYELIWLSNEEIFKNKIKIKEHLLNWIQS